MGLPTRTYLFGNSVDGTPRVAGLCFRCAEHEAVLAGNHTNLNVHAIDRLTKERDELLVALRASRASQQKAQEKEWSAILKAKKAVEMEEVSNLNTQRVVELCEQLSRKLAQQRQQLEQKVQVLKAEAKEGGHAEAGKQTEELAKKVCSLTQHVAVLDGQLDRAHRDKSSLTNQPENTCRNLKDQEEDHAEVYSDLQYRLTQFKMKKDTEGELSELNIKTSSQIEKGALEVRKLSAELVGCRKHLGVVQKDRSQWQDKALSLSEELAKAQRQLHLTRQKRQRAERAHKKEMMSATHSAQERHREMTALLEQTEARHKQRVGEQVRPLSSQNSLIKKQEEEEGSRLVDTT
ncbi:serologically defined colon cancer antigen 8 homolog [Paralichthys olivaceus]|uniref:serologically defined colon cancer antigen 8 homolog n=1 Tax=Paralichthys olivaceus TaxID=8255 RepID=UPI003752F43E